jgi:hypothetical protein
LRILIISQYFWPETFRVNDIVKFLREKNSEVDILTGVPNYPEGKLFEEYKLDNGFRIVLAPNDKENKIFINTIYLTGSLNDPQGKSGLAH